MVERSSPVTVYISAAADLMAERDALARAIVELPVTLAWRIVQSPLEDEPLDREAVQTADLHLLVIGGDIRAPVGLEWHLARRARRRTVAFLKRGVTRTPAGEVFVRQARVQWHAFKGAADLSRQVQHTLAEFLLGKAKHYQLSAEEVERLKALLEEEAEAPEDETDRSAGHSAVVLSQERFMPSEGVALDTP